MNTFCTIITADHFPRALALYTSVAKYDAAAELQVLVADSKPVAELAGLFPQIKIRTVENLADFPLAKELHKKYAHISMDNFRWSMKPVFASWLIENGYGKLIYVDCDMFFVKNYRFLFDELDHHAFILTPHWNNTDPLFHKESFLSNFTSGIFSAGFFGAGKDGLPILRWWANACHFMMGNNIGIGVHDDQRYLDIVPVLFETAKIIRHRGCNIGSWNHKESSRSEVNGEVLINKKHPVIFIHFDEMLVSEILKGHDPLLAPYLKEYKKVFEDHGFVLQDYIKTINLDLHAGSIDKLKWKLKLRTRMKKFFYKLAESL
ncbi:MAG: hypothetical protein ACXWWC_10975 [Chitinophagaceae bacterium]